MVVSFKNRDIVAIDDFSRDELVYLIRKAEAMRKRELNGRRFSTEMRNKSLAQIFYQESTRTRTSFEIAMHELGGYVFGFAGTEGTSIKKNESLFYTILMFEAYHADVMVIRHPNAGSAQWAADVAEVPVLNGGDGPNEHPTQTLLDLVTINQIHPGIDNLSIGLGGDLKNGRTVHSLPLGLSKFENITLHLAAPKILAMPRDLVQTLKARGMNVVEHDNLLDAMKASEIYYQTRPQLNMEKNIPVDEVYRAVEPFKVTRRIIQSLDTKLMHPLPIDSHNEEIEFCVVFSKNQFYLPQAENGVFARKALLLEVVDRKGYKVFDSRYDSDKLNRANNCIYMRTDRSRRKEGLYLDRIHNGIVIDHIELGKATEIVASLNLEKTTRPTVYLGANLRPKGSSEPVKDIIKIFDTQINPRMIKRIIMASPNATFNVIKEGYVVEKFKAILCENKDCITRDIYEDVPPKFYLSDGGIVRCHYCRKPHNLNVTVRDAEDLKKYLASLPKK